MKLQRISAILLAVLFALAALAMAASADETVTVGGATYELITPSSIAITGEGVTPSYRGDGSVDVLMDGSAFRDVANHDNKGVVLILNDEVVARASTPVQQDLEAIPVAYLEMDFGSNVTFDTAYLAIFWQQAGIGEPKDNAVTVETSADGKVWVPVGADGKYYYSLKPCPDYVDGLPNGGSGYPYVGEVAVPLGETVTARYVRYALSFTPMPEDFAWVWYTNVYEFFGLTEIGVANYKSGRKPAMLSAEEAMAERPALEGEWVLEGEDEITFMTFEDVKGEMAYTATVYDKADYDANGAEAEAVDTVEGNFFIEGDVVAIISDGSYDDYTATVGEDGNLTLELDGEEMILVPADSFTAGSPADGDASEDASEDASSDDEPADDTSSADNASSEAASSAASSTSGASSTAGTSSTSGTSSTGNSTSDASEEGGMPTYLIVLIVVAAVALVGAVVGIVVAKKKKN